MCLCGQADLEDASPLHFMQTESEPASASKSGRTDVPPSGGRNCGPVAMLKRREGSKPLDSGRIDSAASTMM